MKYITTLFPSVLESISTDIIRVTSNQLDGLKLKHNNRDYLVGSLALNEGKSPHKAINSSPDEIDYQVLLKSALLLANGLKEESMLNISTGFPFSTFEINKNRALEVIKNHANLVHDTKPYGGNGLKDQKIHIGSTNIVPELIGAIIASRNGQVNISGGMFIVSVGFGTLEIGLSTDDGIIQRTFNSGPGLRYAINSAMKKLQQDYYLGLRTEHQFDDSFHKGNITLNRKRIDLSEVRKNALTEYYEDVISPLIRNAWTDEDFDKSSSLVIVGGGALYSDLINSFRREFDGVLNIIVPEDPIFMASKGYAIHAKKNSEGNSGIAVGIDIGNAHTCISIIEDEVDTITKKNVE